MPDVIRAWSMEQLVLSLLVAVLLMLGVWASGRLLFEIGGDPASERVTKVLGVLAVAIAAASFALWTIDLVSDHDVGWGWVILGSGITVVLIAGVAFRKIAPGPRGEASAGHVLRLESPRGARCGRSRSPRVGRVPCVFRLLRLSRPVGRASARARRGGRARPLRRPGRRFGGERSSDRSRPVVGRAGALRIPWWCARPLGNLVPDRHGRAPAVGGRSRLGSCSASSVGAFTTRSDDSATRSPEAPSRSRSSAAPLPASPSSPRSLSIRGSRPRTSAASPCCWDSSSHWR